MPGGGGSGTVTTVSVASANGVSGSVANATTTPTITLTLGAITPTSVAASGTVTGSNLSGTNTGDQTITLTGDVTGSGTGSFAATLANTAVTAGSYGSATSVPSITFDAQGRATAASGNTIPELASGTYTPTFTIVANIDAVTGYGAQYLRVGSVVTVSGRVDIDPTAVATLTQLGVSLPVASNFTAFEQCGGAGVTPGVAGQAAAVVADATNDRAEIRFTPSDATSRGMFFTFTYQIL